MKNRILLLALMMFASCAAFAQPTYPQNLGTTKTTVKAAGSIEADSILILPIRDTVGWTWYPGSMAGRLTIRPQDMLIYYNNGTAWVTTGASAQSLQATAAIGDSTNTRLKMKRLIIGVASGLSSTVDSSGSIVFGWTDALSSFIYATKAAAIAGGGAMNGGITTASGIGSHAILANNGGIATASGYFARIGGVLWKSAATAGLQPTISATGNHSIAFGYCYQTIASFTKATNITATSDVSIAGGLSQGSSSIRSIDGATIAFGNTRDSGVISATENAAVAIGATEQDGQIHSDGGGTIGGGLANKGWIISGRGIKGVIPSGVTNHGSLVWGTTYWYGSRLGAIGDGSSALGMASVDSCWAGGDTSTHVMGLNLKAYGSFSHMFGRDFRTTRRELFAVGWGSNQFEIDGWDGRVRVNNRTDSLGTLEEMRALVVDPDCEDVVLDVDPANVGLPPSCYGAEDAMIFLDTTGLEITINDVPYDENATYGAGTYRIHATLRSRPTCEKTFLYTIRQREPFSSAVTYSDASYLTTDGEIQVDAPPVITYSGATTIPTVFIDGVNSGTGEYIRYRVDTGWHQVISSTTNDQFSGLCADTQYVHVRAQRDSGSVNTISAGTHTVSTRFKYTVFTGSTSTFTLPAIAANAGINIEIINAGSGTITINSPGGSTILDLPSGSLTPVASTTLATTLSARFLSDGTNWIKR
jgi:hypothetical protein